MSTRRQQNNLNSTNDDERNNNIKIRPNEKDRESEGKQDGIKQEDNSHNVSAA